MCAYRELYGRFPINTECVQQVSKRLRTARNNQTAKGN